jgi:hypothetical protein
VGHVESRFGPFGDSVSLGPQKSFWTHLMEIIGDVGHVESRFDSFVDSVSFGA